MAAWAALARATTARPELVSKSRKCFCTRLWSSLSTVMASTAPPRWFEITYRAGVGAQTPWPSSPDGVPDATAVARRRHARPAVQRMLARSLVGGRAGYRGRDRAHRRGPSHDRYAD